MTVQEVSPLRLDDIQHGDIIAAEFDATQYDPDAGTFSEIQGEVYGVAGMIYVASQRHKTVLNMPLMVRIDQYPIKSVRVIESRAARTVRLDRQARGRIVFEDAPRTAGEVEQNLTDLSEMVLSAQAHSKSSRQAELLRQFHDVADAVRLAKRKRNYMLTMAKLGRHFHPWTDPDPRIFRIETERPLPSDFELDPDGRRDRQRRLDEAIHIFGEAERETRLIAGRMRKRGFEVRRPHPNAQELLVRFQLSPNMRSDVKISPSANGLWETSYPAPSNKKERAAQLRLKRERWEEQVRISLLIATGEGC